MKNCDNRRGVVETTSTGAAQWGEGGHTSSYIHNRGKQTLLKIQGRINFTFNSDYSTKRTNYSSRTASVQNPTFNSKGPQTLPSTARAQKPFLQQQGPTNPSSTSRAHKPFFLQQGHTNPSSTARTHKPFFLQQGHTNPSILNGHQQALSPQ